MSDFSLTLVLQFKTSKIINSMANISIKCEHSKNANQILMCPVDKGNFCRKGSHFFFTFASILLTFINMETINYQAKVNELLGHLSGCGYCAKHLQSFKRECRRIVDYLSVYGTFDGYIQGYSERFGVKLFPARNHGDGNHGDGDFDSSR